MIGREHYFFENSNELTKNEALSEFIKQYYINKLDLPNKIMLPERIEDIELIEKSRMDPTFTKNSQLKDHLNMVTSQFFFKENDLYNNNKLIASIKAIGSSYKAGLIAEGKADLCIKNDSHTKEWDTAPSEIIIKEAGGCMSDIYGKTISYNKKDVFNHFGFIITNNLENLERFKKDE